MIGEKFATELLNKMEPLHPDLERYRHVGAIGPIIHHPLVIQPLFNDDKLNIHNAFINAQYLHKKAAVDQALTEHDWSRYLGLHERPYRLNAFQTIHSLMNDAEYWEHLSWLWTDSENINQNLRVWRNRWHSKRPGRETVMDDEERAALAALPDRFPIWRGVSVKAGIKGLSWSLDQDKARWFGVRFHRNLAYLVHAEVEKRHVLAHFIGRNESEIVVLPERCKTLKVETIFR